MPALAGEIKVIRAANKMDFIEIVSSIMVHRHDLSEPKASYADVLELNVSACEYL